MYAPTTLPQKEVEVGAIADPSYLSRPRGGRRHLPRPAVHRDRLRRERHGVRRLADHGHAARDLDLDRRRPRHRSRRCSRATRSTSTPPCRGVREALRAERQGAHHLRPSPARAGGGNLVLRIETGDAANWAYAADNTQLFFVLRPVVGAKPTKPSHGERSYGAEVEGSESDSCRAARYKHSSPSSPESTPRTCRTRCPAGEDFNVVGVVSGAEEALTLAARRRRRPAPRRLRRLLGPRPAAPGRGGPPEPRPERDGARARVAERLPQARVRGRRRRHRHAPGDAGAGPLRDPQAARAQAGRRDAAAERALAARLRPRPEGRHRQDAHARRTSPSASRSAARRSRSSTSTSSSATSPCASGCRPRRRSTTSPSRRARSTGTSSRRSWRTTPRACTRSSRRGAPTRRAPSAPSSCARSTRSCARTTTGSSSTRLRASPPR